MVERPAFDLFGRHVRHRADDGPDLGPEVSDVFAKSDCVRVNRARQSEIENLDPAVVSDHDVRGFQIAVDDVFPMRRRKRVGQRNRDIEEPRGCESAGWNHFVERRPLDELHRHERHTIVFLDGEDGDDVRVVERGDDLGFPLEARQTVGVSRESVGKNLQRNITIQFRVACTVDLAHPAGAERRDDFIGTEARSSG